MKAAAAPTGCTRRSGPAATAAACAHCAATPHSCARQPPGPPPKKVASWILTPPGSLADADRAAVAGITARCEELTATRALVREFAVMLCHRSGSKLPGWADQAEASPVRELRSFAAGLRKDWARTPLEEPTTCRPSAESYFELDKDRRRRRVYARVASGKKPRS